MNYGFVFHHTTHTNGRRAYWLWRTIVGIWLKKAIEELGNPNVHATKRRVLPGNKTKLHSPHSTRAAGR